MSYFKTINVIIVSVACVIATLIVTVALSLEAQRNHEHGPYGVKPQVVIAECPKR